jgi:hypothetical protein
MTAEEKKQLQKDYEAIVSFRGDWSKDLREKYNLTYDEIIANIEL